MNTETVKIVVFVPESHADAVRKAVGDAGAGKIGNYSHCSFSSKGQGRFLPLPGTNPTIGQVGKPETVEEERIEFVCERSLLKKVIEAMKKTHPYEEVAFDVYPLENL
jgi:hypothetical protein